MADSQSKLDKAVGSDADPGTSSVPLLGSAFQEGSDNKTKNGADVSEPLEVDAKTGKRRFWNFGRKKEDESLKKKADTVTPDSTGTSSMASALQGKPAMIPNIRPVSPITGVGGISALSKTTSHPYSLPSSPGRNLNSSSPAPPSPASSQIFERSVQEDGLAATASPAIPAHITTENHIPPVLDVASAAITDNQLNPDNVEIVMHAAHQPAAVTVTGTGTSEALGESMHESDLLPEPRPRRLENDDTASNYGALDSNDVRRLSFISFADVVHAEHVSDHANLGGTTSPAAPHNRSPSPARSPLSTQALSASPILGSSPSSGGMEGSPNRVGRLGSPPLGHNGHSPPTGDELTIETMRQALRKTGSGDLSGARSPAPTSAVGDNDGTSESHVK